MNEQTAAQKVIARAAGQIDRLQAVNERQKHIIDTMLQFLRERNLVTEYNAWARTGPRIKREIQTINLPDINPGGDHKTDTPGAEPS